MKRGEKGYLRNQKKGGEGFIGRDKMVRKRGKHQLRVETKGGGRPNYVGLGIIRVIRQGDDSLCTTRADMIRPNYGIKKRGESIRV